MPRYPNLAVLQHELAAGGTSHLHPHQLTMLQCCSSSGGEGLILEFLPSQDPKNSLSEPHSSTDSTAAQCSLHKAKPALYLTAIPLALQPNITYPRTHPKGKTGEGSNFSPPWQDQHFCCAQDKAQELYGCKTDQPEAPSDTCSEVVQHLLHLQLETGNDLLDQLSIQKSELPWRFQLQSSGASVLLFSSIDWFLNLGPFCPAWEQGRTGIQRW